MISRYSLVVIFSLILGSVKAQTTDKEVIVQGGQLTLVRDNGMYFVQEKGSQEFIHLVPGRLRRILSKMTEDCPLVELKINKIKNVRPNDARKTPYGITPDLDITIVASLIRDYNECVSASKPNLTGMPRVISVALIGGIDYTTTTFSTQTGTVTGYLGEKPLRDKSLFQGGLDITLKSYKISNFVGFYTGALLNKNSYYQVVAAKPINGSLTSTEKYTLYDEHSLSYTQLKIPLGFEFSRPSTEALTYHARLGVVFSKMLTMESSHPRSEVVFDDEPHGVQYISTATIKKYRASPMLNIALGVDYRVMSKSKVRLQAAWTAGVINVKTQSPNAGDDDEYHPAKGFTSSFSLMSGFIF